MNKLGSYRGLHLLARSCDIWADPSRKGPDLPCRKDGFSPKIPPYLLQAPLSKAFFPCVDPKKFSLILNPPKEKAETKKRSFSAIDHYLLEGYKKLPDHKKTSSIVEASFGQKTQEIEKQPIAGKRAAAGIKGLLIGAAVYTPSVLKYLLSASALPGSSLITAGALAVGAAFAHARDKKCDKDHFQRKNAGAIINPSSVNDLGLSPQLGVAQAIATDNSTDTEQWRFKLIEAANHSILLSGSYVGGSSFNKLLDAVEKRMEEKKDLKVVIIGSSKFLGPSNLKKIENLTKKHPENFSFILCQSHFAGHDEIKIIDNHAKCLVIDGGKYFILGGSGVENSFTVTGVDGLSKGHYLKKEEDPEETAPLGTVASLIKSISPEGWRDRDTIFYSPDGTAGSPVYKQMLLLALKYEQLGEYESGKEPQKLEAESLGAFTGIPLKEKQGDSVTVRMLKSPIPESKETVVPYFEEGPQQKEQGIFKLLASSPDMNKSPFGEEVLHRIQEAKKEIVLSHMYFHPTPKLKKALSDAANRGVKIKIISNGEPKKWLSTRTFFGSRTLFDVHDLIQMTSKENRQNIDFYSFIQKKADYHTKCITFDEEITIEGSCNFGKKGLQTSSDHELTSIFYSKAFAEKKNRITETDISLSIKVDTSKPLPTLYYIIGKIHGSIQWLIG